LIINRTNIVVFLDKIYFTQEIYFFLIKSLKPWKIYSNWQFSFCSCIHSMRKQKKCVTVHW